MRAPACAGRVGGAAGLSTITAARCGCDRHRTGCPQAPHHATTRGDDAIRLCTLRVARAGALGAYPASTRRGMRVMALGCAGRHVREGAPVCGPAYLRRTAAAQSDPTSAAATLFRCSGGRPAVCARPNRDAAVASAGARPGLARRQKSIFDFRMVSLSCRRSSASAPAGRSKCPWPSRVACRFTRCMHLDGVLTGSRTTLLQLFGALANNLLHKSQAGVHERQAGVDTLCQVPHLCTQPTQHLQSSHTNTANM